MLESSLGSRLRDVEADIDRDLKPRSAPLKGWTATLEVNVRRPTLAVKNVVGVLEGSGALAKETLVFGAHYDHLGYGGANSLARDRKPAIHHGADDNGSGTTMLMELARRFSSEGKQELGAAGLHGFQRRGERPVGLGFLLQEPALPADRYRGHDQHGHGRPAPARQGGFAEGAAGSVGHRHRQDLRPADRRPEQQYAISS